MSKLVEGDGLGRYIIADKSYHRGDIIWQGVPLVTAFNSIDVLQHVCSSCCRPQDQMSVCTGCRQLHYCSKRCQKIHWKTVHKFECKVFAQMHPNHPAGAVMLVLRALFVVRNHGDALMSLEAHSKAQLQAPRFPDLAILIHGIATIMQETDRSLIEGLFHRLTINSMELVSATLEPLGVVLDPFIARLNHSCSPNTYITFDGGTAYLHAFNKIQPDEPITISYMDVRENYHRRQSQLLSRYYFSCKCARCNTFPKLLGTLERSSECYLCCGHAVFPDSDGSYECSQCSNTFPRLGTLEAEAERVLSDQSSSMTDTTSIIDKLHREIGPVNFTQPLFALHIQATGLGIRSGVIGEALQYALRIVNFPLVGPTMSNDLVHLYKTMQLAIAVSGDVVQWERTGLVPVQLAALAWYLAFHISKEVRITHGPSMFTQTVLAKIAEFEQDLSLGLEGRDIILASRRNEQQYLASLSPLFRAIEKSLCLCS